MHQMVDRGFSTSIYTVIDFERQLSYIKSYFLRLISMNLLVRTKSLIVATYKIVYISFDCEFTTFYSMNDREIRIILYFKFSKFECHCKKMYSI